MRQPTIDLHTAPAYQILAAAGKTVLRPGGRSATEKLFTWANFQPGETVLELASGLGISAISLAKRYGVRVVGIEQDADRVIAAQANIKAAGLADRVQIIQGNIFHLQALTEKFDYVLAEAILTMQSPLGKAQILDGVRDRLKPGGHFLSHELLIAESHETIQTDLVKVMHVNATPLAESDWIKTLDQAQLEVEHCETGAMNLLNPIQIFQDEGMINAIRLFWNIISHPVLRDRVLTIRQVLTQHRQNLGYVTLYAVLHQIS
jgi:cyclopropane fatty-acyl-phospholipid synthase-like methyltransferase